MHTYFGSGDVAPTQMQRIAASCRQVGCNWTGGCFKASNRVAYSRSFSAIRSQMAPGGGDSTKRFSKRVSDYVSSRPSYPPEVVSLLSSHFDLQPNARIADIGSGTGISAELLFQELKDLPVEIVGIEPNKEMREAGDEYLSSHGERGFFSSRDGTAENTGLEDGSVDLVIAAQAYHWFDPPKAREECQRILKKNGKSGVALIWNERRGVEPKVDYNPDPYSSLDSPVMNAYDLLLVRRAKDYEKVSHNKTVDEASLKTFFGPPGFKIASFPNPYRLDFEQLKGRLLSSSYTPLEGEEGYEVMMDELRHLFEKYQTDGKIDFLYNTNIFYGSLQ